MRVARFRYRAACGRFGKKEIYPTNRVRVKSSDSQKCFSETKRPTALGSRYVGSIEKTSGKALRESVLALPLLIHVSLCR